MFVVFKQAPSDTEYPLTHVGNYFSLKKVEEAIKEGLALTDPPVLEDNKTYWSYDQFENEQEWIYYIYHTYDPYVTIITELAEEPIFLSHKKHLPTDLLKLSAYESYQLTARAI